MELSVKIAGLELKNPVMVASGTFAYGEEFQDSLYDISKLGDMGHSHVRLGSCVVCGARLQGAPAPAPTPESTMRTGISILLTMLVVRSSSQWVHYEGERG